MYSLVTVTPLIFPTRPNNVLIAIGLREEEVGDAIPNLLLILGRVGGERGATEELFIGTRSFFIGGGGGVGREGRDE